MFDFFQQIVTQWRKSGKKKSKVTNKLGEVHIQSFTVAKVRVHPTAMQNHLGHAFLNHLVILRPEGSWSTAEQLETHRKIWVTQTLQD